MQSELEMVLLYSVFRIDNWPVVIWSRDFQG